MVRSVEVYPPHSIIIISQPGQGEIPHSLGDSIIASTASCVAVGCKPEIDGATKIEIGYITELYRKEKPMFDGVISTPSCKIAVHNVFNDILLEIETMKKRTRILIWTNDLHEPDTIIIGVDQ